MRFVLTEKKLFYLLVFTVVALAAYQVNFSPILGMENKSFTLFQFIAPIGAGLFNAAFGVAAVLLAGTLNFLYTGQLASLTYFVTLATMSFAAIYFGTKTRWILAVPLACMALFALHPIGGQVWWYSLFWLIPVAARFSNRLLPRAFGATFTAHAIGSVAYLYAFNLPAQVWAALPPTVAFERTVFALGIAGSFIVFNSVLNRLSARLEAGAINVDARYVLPRPVEAKER
jgi:hypothetical protein